MTKKELEQLTFPVIVDGAAGAIVKEHGAEEKGLTEDELIKNFVMEQIEDVIAEKWILYYLDEELLVRDRGADLSVHYNMDDLEKYYDLERLDY